MVENLTRRQALQLGGATALIAVAGCIGDDDDTGGTTGDAPAYAEGIPTVDDEVFILYLDIEGLDELEDELEDEDDGPQDDDSEFGEIEDPLLGLATAGLIGIAFVAGFAFIGTGLSGILDDEDEFETSISELYLANDAVVAGGDIDTDEVDDALTDVPEGGFMTAYEQVDEVGNYVFYEPADGNQEQVLAVSDNRILLGDTRPEIDPIVETDSGDRAPAIEEYEAFEWLLSTAGHGHLVFAGYSPDGFEDEEPAEVEGETDEFEEIIGANGLSSSLTLGDREMNADLALEFDELSEETRAEIEELLEEETAALAETYSLEFDGNRVVASATYSEDALDTI